MAQLNVSINSRKLEQFFRQFPTIANSEANKGWNRAAREFMLDFSKRRLRKGIFQVKRKVKLSRPPRGQPNIGPKARRAGFKAVLINPHKLLNKRVRISTSNPLLTVREAGLPIFPRHGEFLFIRVPFVGKHAKDKTATLAKKLNPRGDKRFTRSGRPIVGKVRKVGPFPRLGFKAAFKSFKGRVFKQRLLHIRSEITRRSNLRLEKKAARIAAKAAEAAREAA